MAESPKRRSIDIYERISRVITLGFLAAAVIAAAAAPVMAITWSNLPFPGFMVEPTLVANGNGGTDWPGSLLGIAYPQRVVRIAGAGVVNGPEYNAVLATLGFGDEVSFFTQLPDGTQRLYPMVRLVHFPQGEFTRLFWLPYLIGVAYLGIAIWMYRLRGMTRPGRAFVMFGLCTSIVCTLLFDLASTHAGAGVWTAAVAVIGGTLISLALRFPKEWAPVARRPWLLGVPYLFSIGLTLWGVNALANASAPWNYIAAWGYSYRYIGIGILLFLAMMVYRARAPGARVVRQQARIVLAGSMIGFAPIVIWALAPMFGRTVHFNVVLFLPGLLIFPLGVAIAIFRYRLLEVEVILNRTIFYGLLTAILAGVFSVMSGFTQQLFLRTTGRRTDAAIIMTTLVVVSLVEPIKQRTNAFVRTRFKDIPETTGEIKQLGEEVRAFLQMSDAEQLSGHLLTTVANGLRAENGAVSLYGSERLRVVGTYGRWNGDAHLVLPLQVNGVRYGMLAIGPRVDRSPYSQQECLVVADAVGRVAQSIHFATLLRGLMRTVPQGGDDEAPRGAASEPISAQPLELALGAAGLPFRRAAQHPTSSKP